MDVDADADVNADVDVDAEMRVGRSDVVDRTEEASYKDQDQTRGATPGHAEVEAAANAVGQTVETSGESGGGSGADTPFAAAAAAPSDEHEHEHEHEHRHFKSWGIVGLAFRAIEKAQSKSKALARVAMQPPVGCCKLNSFHPCIESRTVSNS